MKKLEQISVDKKQIFLFTIKNATKGEYHIVDMMQTEKTVPKEFIDSLFAPKGTLSYAAKRAGMKFVCDSSPDFMIIQEAFLYLSPYPDAQKMLWHYLTGKKEEVEVNTERVFLADGNMASFAKSEISRALKANKTEGDIPFSQPQYSNQNWKNAFGGVHIKWRVNANNIDVWLEDEYQWHPKDRRTTQCLHMAMERAEKYGASKFKYRGTILKIPKSQFEKIINVPIRPM